MNNSIIYLSNPANVSMHPEWFDIATDDHFWMQWRSAVLRTNLPIIKKIKAVYLEIGCGHGNVLRYLEEEGYRVNGCDLDVEAMSSATGIRGRLYCYDIFSLSAEMTGKYDGVFLMDVLEHIDDDLDFLKTACKHLKEEGLVIVNVPALNVLMSKYDHLVGHKRRYSKEMIRKLFDEVGIEEVTVTYWGFFLLPIAALRKLLLYFQSDSSTIKSGFKPPSRFINNLLIGLMKMERKLIPAPPVGTSIFAIGKLRRLAFK